MKHISTARISAAILITAMLSASGFAQQPTAAPTAPALQAPRTGSQPPQAGSSDVLPIPNATPAHLAAARDLVLSSGLSRSFDGAIPEMMRNLLGTVTRTRPELANDMKATMDELRPEFMKLTGDMIENSARIYTALLNEQECKDAVAFFKSPTGVKFIDLQPTIFANLGQLLEQWNKFLSQRMFEMTRVAMKKKGHDI